MRKRIKAEKRAKWAVKLGRMLLEPLEVFGTAGTLSSKAQTDFIVAQLHALMLAMPERK